MSNEYDDQVIGQLFRERKEATDVLRELKSRTRNWRMAIRKAMIAIIRLEEQGIEAIEIVSDMISKLPDEDALRQFQFEHQNASKKLDRAERKLANRGFIEPDST